MTTDLNAFPFPSLDFQGRTTIGLGEIAAKFGCTVSHLLNECESGALCGLDLKGAKATRRNVRVPVESYRAYVFARMTGSFHRDFIRNLPRKVQQELLIDLKEAMKV